MKVEELLIEFTEKYDREFMEYVQENADNIGVSYHKLGFQGYNVVRAIDQFKSFIENYADYKINHKDDPRATPQDLVVERVNHDIEEGLFIEGKVLYSEAPHIVGSYIHGLQAIEKLEESCKKKMFESGVDYDSIGDLSRFTEQFIEKLHGIMESIMEGFGKGSGYYSTKALLTPPKKKKQEIFL